MQLLAGLGDGESPGGPLQQAGLQAPLEIVHPPGYHRRRESQLAGGLDEAAGLHHPHEGLELGESVHGIIFE